MGSTFNVQLEVDSVGKSGESGQGLLQSFCIHERFEEYNPESAFLTTVCTYSTEAKTHFSPLIMLTFCIRYSCQQYLRCSRTCCISHSPEQRCGGRLKVPSYPAEFRQHKRMSEGLKDFEEPIDQLLKS